MKDVLKIVFVGHVDHGKSTLIGRLLYNTGAIPEDKIKDMMYLDEGKQKIDYAFLMDHFEEERKQGITIDTAQIFFETNKRKYVIIDAPGHKEFIVNMITGASQADVAVLIVDACEGIQEQTKRHAYLLSMLGIKKIVLVVSKMDLVQYNSNVYGEIVYNLKSFLTRVNIENISTVPISAIEDENVTEKSKKMNWYIGLPLIDILDNIDVASDRNTEYSLFAVQDIYHIEIRNVKQRLILGKVEMGEFNRGQLIYALPSGESTRIKSVERYNCQCEKAILGDCVGFTIEDSLFIERGNILVKEKKDVTVAVRFKAIVFWMSSDSGFIGEKVDIKCSTQESGACIEKINNKVNSATLEIIKDDIFHINKLEICEMVISTKKPIVIGKISEFKSLSRFILTMNDIIVASGIITEV